MKIALICLVIVINIIMSTFPALIYLLLENIIILIHKLKQMRNDIR